MSKRQKKILWFSLLLLVVLALVVILSFVMFSPEDLGIITDKVQTLITTSLITYASAALLVAKIVAFIVDETIKNKKRKPTEHLNKIINKGEINMTKDRKIAKEYNIHGFKFIVNEKKGIHISFDNVELMGSEDFYQKLKAANAEFLEQIRKSLKE